MSKAKINSPHGAAQSLRHCFTMSWGPALITKDSQGVANQLLDGTPDSSRCSIEEVGKALLDLGGLVMDWQSWIQRASSRIVPGCGFLVLGCHIQSTSSRGNSLVR